MNPQPPDELHQPPAEEPTPNQTPVPQAATPPPSNAVATVPVDTLKKHSRRPGAMLLIVGGILLIASVIAFVLTQKDTEDVAQKLENKSRPVTQTVQQESEQAAPKEVPNKPTAAVQSQFTQTVLTAATMFAANNSGIAPTTAAQIISEIGENEYATSNITLTVKTLYSEAELPPDTAALYFYVGHTCTSTNDGAVAGSSREYAVLYKTQAGTIVCTSN